LCIHIKYIDSSLPSVALNDTSIDSPFGCPGWHVGLYRAMPPGTQHAGKPGPNRQAAVKVTDDRGIESLKVVEVK